MMGMGRGGASQSKDKRRNSLGYIAPTIEEEEEFQPSRWRPWQVTAGVPANEAWAECAMRMTARR